MEHSMESNGTESARRVADVLLGIAEAGEPIGVNDLARRTRLSPAVVHRIVRALGSRDLVEQDPQSQRYSVGSAAILLGAQALARTNLRDIARPALERLMRQTRQTATLSVLVGTQRTYVDQVLPDSEMRFSVETGRPYSLQVGSSGRIMLAYLPETIARSILGANVEESAGSEAAASLDDTLAKLRQVRAEGAAVSRGERIPGAAGVAAAIRNERGSVIGAINIVGPIHEFGEDVLPRLIQQTREAAGAVEEILRDGP
jgi:IclR family acetate operon transcriptional repressor